jgi:hypothetical protein
MDNALLKRTVRALKWGMYAIWAIAGLCLLFDAASSLYIVLVEEPALDRFLADASATNGRGDEVMAETDRDPSSPLGTKTVIRLKEEHRWFPTTLLLVESRDYLVGFRWRKDDRLVLLLNFGCNAHITVPVERVGPIHILYRFGFPAFPAHGYDSFPRDAERKPCE